MRRHDFPPSGREGLETSAQKQAEETSHLLVIYSESMNVIYCWKRTNESVVMLDWEGCRGRGFSRLCLFINPWSTTLLSAQTGSPSGGLLLPTWRMSCILASRDSCLRFRRTFVFSMDLIEDSQTLISHFLPRSLRRSGAAYWRGLIKVCCCPLCPGGHKSFWIYFLAVRKCCPSFSLMSPAGSHTVRLLYLPGGCTAR